MTREQLSEIIGGIDDRQIAEARRYEPARRNRSPERNGSMKAKRILTLALAAALILALGVTAYAVRNRRIQDLVMKSGEEEAAADIEIVGGEEDIAVVPEDEIALVDENGGPLPTPVPEESNTVPYDPLAGDSDMISLQGFAGSPEYQAALAWAEFQHGYDRDGEILTAVGNSPTPWDEKYAPAYFVYSQEMADTIDAIAAEYGLALHSGFTSASIDELCGRFGNFCTQTIDGYGYCYADGTFQCDCENSEVMFQIRRSMKGVLDTVGLNVRDVEDYEQWEYATACGETVLLALAPRHALILAESGQSFTVVNVMAGADFGFTAEKLQALADSIDFSIL